MTRPEQNIPVVQRHKSSGEVWRRIERLDGEPGPIKVRVQREGRQRVLWLSYWLDGNSWEAV